MSDELEARLLAAQRRAWLATKAAEHGPEVTRHYQRLAELKEDGDLEGMWDYWTGVQKLRDGTGLVHE